MMVNLWGVLALILAALGCLVLYVRVGVHARRALRRCGELESQLELLFDCSRSFADQLARARDDIEAKAVAKAPAEDRAAASDASTALPTFATIDRGAVETHWVAPEAELAASSPASDVPVAIPSSPDDGGRLSHTERQLLARLAPGLS